MQVQEGKAGVFKGGPPVPTATTLKVKGSSAPLAQLTPGGHPLLLCHWWVQSLSSDATSGKRGSGASGQAYPSFVLFFPIHISPCPSL